MFCNMLPSYDESVLRPSQYPNRLQTKTRLDQYNLYNDEPYRSHGAPYEDRPRRTRQRSGADSRYVAYVGWHIQTDFDGIQYVQYVIDEYGRIAARRIIPVYLVQPGITTYDDYPWTVYF